MFEVVSDIYRLLGILHTPPKIGMLVIGGETSVVKEVLCSDLHCTLD